MIAAIPIVADKNNIKKILKVNKNLSQIFKDFPLIGCEKIKWNAIINSKKFYPN